MGPSGRLIRPRPSFHGRWICSFWLPSPVRHIYLYNIRAASQDSGTQNPSPNYRGFILPPMPPPPPPTERFSQLSIESMPPTTRLQSRTLQDFSSEESDDASGDSGLDEGQIMFPSKLTYSLETLDEDAREHVINAMEDPPQLVLQQCQAKDQRKQTFPYYQHPVVVRFEGSGCLVREQRLLDYVSEIPCTLVGLNEVFTNPSP